MSSYLYEIEGKGPIASGEYLTSSAMGVYSADKNLSGMNYMLTYAALGVVVVLLFVYLLLALLKPEWFS